MAQVRSWAGLDVHRASVFAATMDRETGEMRLRRLPGETREVVGFCASLPGPTRVAYEAGPTGFGLARALAAAGIECVIAAPGKIERPSSDRVKTDERDAQRLLRLLMIDALHAVRVPSTQEEALRDLVRAREDIRGDLMRARHRMSKLLLRHDVRFDGSASAWTTHHRAWLSRVDLGERGAQAALMDYLGAIDALLIRRDTLEATIDELTPGSPWADTIARLRCLRGIDTLSAVGLCAEIGDWSRFPKAAHVMSYLGLVPSEDSTGSSRRLARSRRPAAGTAADCSSRRPGITAAHRAAARSSSAAKPGSPHTSSRSPGRRSAGCIALGSAWTQSAASAARSSRSPSRVSSPASAGRPRTPTEPANTTSVKEAAGPSRHHAREHPRLHYEQPFRRPRSILDSGLSRRNMVLRQPVANPAIREYQSDHRRAHAGPAAPLTDTMPAMRGHLVLGP